MKIDFDETFKSNKLSESKVPDVLLKYFSSKLPSKDLKYKSTEEGVCFITSDTGNLSFGGITFKVDEDMRACIGDHPTLDEVFDYSFNTQKYIEMEPIKQGEILINGEIINTQDLIKNPYEGIKFNNGRLYMSPKKFPTPIEIDMSLDDFHYPLKLYRVPSEVVSCISFESDSKKPLKFSLTLDRKPKAMKATLSYDFKYTASVDELIDCAKLYNGFFMGKVKIGDIKFNPDKKIENQINEKFINVMEKISALEKKMRVNFNLEEIEVNRETEILVEELYQGIILDNPIRDNQRIQSLSFEADGTEFDAYEDKELFLTYGSRTDITLFGSEISVFGAFYVFMAKVSDIRYEGGKVFVSLVDAKKDESMYMVVRTFLSEEELEEYLNNQDKEKVDFLRNAKTLTEYMKKS